MGNRRIGWGLGVMLVGACAAWPFRKSWLPEEQVKEPAAAATADVAAGIAIPTRLIPAPAEETQVPSVPARGDLQPLISALRPVSERKAARIENPAGLPGLAADYTPHPQLPPVDPRSSVLSPEASSQTDAPLEVIRRPRHYRIGKHDTLEGIAERLLGSPQYAEKLLAANPGVILVPEILPVGATIIIPDVHEPAESLVRVPQADD